MDMNLATYDPREARAQVTQWNRDHPPGTHVRVTLDNGVTNISRTNLVAATITSSGGGFYLSLSRNVVGSQMDYSFNWGSATKTP